MDTFRKVFQETVICLCEGPGHALGVGELGMADTGPSAGRGGRCAVEKPCVWNLTLAGPLGAGERAGK